MALDYESFDGDDFESRGSKRSGRVRKRAGGWMGQSRKEEKEKLTPEIRISQKLASFEPKKNNTQSEIEDKLQAKQAYLSFISMALSAGGDPESLIDDKDIIVSFQNEGKLVNVRHKLTGFFKHGMENAPAEVQIEVAKDELSRTLINHLKDWNNVSPEFRESVGVHTLPLEEGVV